ncbi:MAG: alpha/beta hydrolase [Desulfobacteraceae bacterium]|nr:alpha/beta hydrolase [Desulfobacteraceae bacterium]
MLNKSVAQHTFYTGNWPLSKTKKTIVFIHGAGQCAGIWENQVDALSQQVNTLAVDLPGHGLRIQDPGKDSIEAYSAYLIEFINALLLKKVILCGHSMGGAIVQRLLHDCKTDFVAGIVANSGARLRVNPKYLKLASKNYPAFLEQIFVHGFAPENQTLSMQNRFKQLCKCHPQTAVQDYTACDNFNMAALIDGIQRPVLVIASDVDKMIPFKYSAYLAKKIPQGQLRVIEAAGHHATIENGAAVNRIIIEFLEHLDQNV